MYFKPWNLFLRSNKDLCAITADSGVLHEIKNLDLHYLSITKRFIGENWQKIWNKRLETDRMPDQDHFKFASMININFKLY